MSNLRNKLIRLAHAKPELRPDLLPLIREASATKKAFMRPGEMYVLNAVKTPNAPQGYPGGYARFVRKMPPGMGLGGYVFRNDRGREIFVPFEDAKAVIGKTAAEIPK